MIHLWENRLSKFMFNELNRTFFSKNVRVAFNDKLFGPILKSIKV